MEKNKIISPLPTNNAEVPREEAEKDYPQQPEPPLTINQ